MLEAEFETIKSPSVRLSVPSDRTRSRRIIQKGNILYIYMNRCMGMLVRELHRAVILYWIGTVGKPIWEMSEGKRGSFEAFICVMSELLLYRYVSDTPMFLFNMKSPGELTRPFI
jgi:hypothetical protein